MKSDVLPGMTAFDVFTWKVNKEDNGCWRWIGTITENGYPVFSHERKRYYAHRFSYEHYKGPLNGLNCCHTCDNSLCVNPDHLFAGTQKDNIQDSINKGKNIWCGKTPEQRAEIMAKVRSHKYSEYV